MNSCRIQKCKYYMIIGKGLIGAALERVDRNEYVFFASGVSNSKTSDAREFIREKDLLAKTLSENIGKCFIYFSTTSIYDTSVNSNLYIKHKLEVEQYIEENVTSYLIIRTGNIVGEKGNANTIFSFLVNNIRNSIPFVLWENSYRNFLDIDDFVSMVDLAVNHLNKKNEIICLLNPNDIQIANLVSLIENKVNIKGNYLTEKKGSSFFTDKSLSINLFGLLELAEKDYEIKLVEKYV